MRHLLPMLAASLGPAACADDAPPVPERPDPLADLTPWPDPYAEEPDPWHLDGLLTAMEWTEAPSFTVPDLPRPDRRASAAAKAAKRAERNRRLVERGGFGGGR